MKTEGNIVYWIALNVVISIITAIVVEGIMHQAMCIKHKHFKTPK